MERLLGLPVFDPRRTLGLLWLALLLVLTVADFLAR